MNKGTIVYRKSAPYMGVGTVISRQGEQATVRWGAHGDIRLHRASDLQQVGVPVKQ